MYCTGRSSSRENRDVSLGDKRMEIATACSSGHHSSQRYLEPYREFDAFYSDFQVVTRNKCLFVFSVCTCLLSDQTNKSRWECLIKFIIFHL